MPPLRADNPRRRRTMHKLALGLGLAAALADFEAEAAARPDADADLTLLPAYCRGHYAKTIAHQ